MKKVDEESKIIKKKIMKKKVAWKTQRNKKNEINTTIIS